MRVAILGLGEAGTLYAAGFAAAGVELTGFCLLYTSDAADE